MKNFILGFMLVAMILIGGTLVASEHRVKEVKEINLEFTGSVEWVFDRYEI